MISIDVGFCLLPCLHMRRIHHWFPVSL